MVIVHPFQTLLQDFVQDGLDQLLFRALQSLFIAIFLYTKKKLAYLPEAKYQTPKTPKVSLSSRTNLLEGEIAQNRAIEYKQQAGNGKQDKDSQHN